MRKHWVLWAIIIVLAYWFFHLHYLRGVPVKRR